MGFRGEVPGSTPGDDFLILFESLLIVLGGILVLPIFRLEEKIKGFQISVTPVSHFSLLSVFFFFFSLSHASLSSSLGDRRSAAEGERDGRRLGLTHGGFIASLSHG
ncbi:hypothetical protein Dimus_038197 [Dionaea muscipula]